ncbi:hypothetical protein N7519_008470 [Penicillium mononematosum]|uniref:uncharacterized protein n=1 Tax=Penicillium mononematosum TaxID=268346 RepID=UPI002547C004|nr:uncharacterized protein N7519_008470 [Penicillium mononematosum]KAJ6178009.1 hypothetical protein N7519_008470 [Penicillium mononematosum]
MTLKILHRYEVEPDETFIAAWQRTSPDIALRDVDRKIIPGWDKLPDPSFGPQVNTLTQVVAQQTWPFPG